MALSFDLDVRFRPIIYREARNSTTEALGNSYGQKISPGCPIQAHNILRCLKLNIKAQGKFERPKLLTRMSDSGQIYIETLEIVQ